MGGVKNGPWTKQVTIGPKNIYIRTAHLKPRANLCELHVLMARLEENMMTGFGGVMRLKK